MMPDNAEQRIALLESKVQELDTLVNLALRLLTVEKPVSALLERYGATQAENHAVHTLLDDVARRAEQGGIYTAVLRRIPERDRRHISDRPWRSAVRIAARRHVEAGQARLPEDTRVCEGARVAGVEMSE